MALAIGLPALPALAYEMLVNGNPATAQDFGVAGQSVTFSVTGSGTPSEFPTCTESTFTYSFEDGVTHTASGTGLTVSAAPGNLVVHWSRGPSQACNGYGTASAFFYAYVAPTFKSIVTDPPDIKINQPVLVTVSHEPCRAVPGNPNSSDPCQSDKSVDPGDCPGGSFCLGRSYYDRLGTFTIRGRVFNLAGSSEGTITVDVKPTEKPLAQFQVPSPTAGIPVQFTNLTLNGVRSYFWDFGDGTTSAEESPLHTFPATDDYVVRLTATNELGSHTAEQNLFVAARSGGTAPTAANFVWSPNKAVIGQVVQFTDTSTGSIARWRWNFADGSPPDYRQNPTHAYLDWGQKNVELWVSNQFGRKGIILFLQVLSNTTPPLADFTFEPFNVRVGSPVKFTDTSAGATSWVWDFGENGATSTEQHPTFTYSTTGQKAVTLRVANAFGNDTITKFFPCHPGEDTGLDSRFSWTPFNPNPGVPVQFLDLSTGSPERWTWTVSDGAQSGQKNFTHVFAATGQYSVSLRVEKGNASSVLSQVVRVGSSSGPIPDFGWTPVTPEPDERVAFTNLSQNSVSYAWDFGDGTTSTAVDPEHRFAAVGTYEVKLTATSSAGLSRGNGAATQDNGGTSQSITKQLVVSRDSAVPVASFTASPNPANVNQVVRFTDTSTGIPTQWQWDFGYQNQKSQFRNPSHAFPAVGTYLVTLIAKNAKGTSRPITHTVVVTNVVQKPEPDFDWTPNPPAAGQLVTFTDKSKNVPLGWLWRFDDGSSSQTGKSVSHTFAKAGDYVVTLEVSNAAGLSTLHRTVTVTEPQLQADFAVDAPKLVVGAPVTFRNTSTGVVLFSQWKIDRAVVAETPNVTWTFQSGGEHVIELQVRGSSGQQSIRQKAITILGAPVASFKLNGRLMSGGTVSFIDTSTGNPTKQTWFVEGKLVGTGASVSVRLPHVGVIGVRLVVENDAGRDGVTRDFNVNAPDSERPKLLAVTAKYGPCLFSMFPMSDPMELDVDWRNKPPGQVTMEINGIANPPIVTTGPKVGLNLDSNRLDYQREDVTSNKLVFTALGPGGIASEPLSVQFFGVNPSSWLRLANAARDIDEPKRRSFARGIHLPPEPFSGGGIPLPDFLGGGTAGVSKTQFKFEKIYRTDCSMLSTVEMTGGLTIGKVTGGIKGYASSERKLTETTGSSSEEVSLGFEAFATGETEKEVLEVMPTMAIPCSLPFVSSVCSAAKVKLQVRGSLGGVAEFTVVPDEGEPTGGELVFRDSSSIVKLSLGLTGTLALGSARFEVFGGGKGAVKFGRLSDNPFIKKADLGAEFGARLLWFGTVSEYKMGAVCTYEPFKDLTCNQSALSARGPVTDAILGSLRPVAPLSRTEAVEDISAEPPILLRNVSLLSDPAATSRDEQTLVVFLSENATAGAALQRFDVKTMRRSGSLAAWTEPKNVTTDAMGDFNPIGAIHTSGRAVVAWERIRNPAFAYSDIPTLADMPKLLREVEIAVSTSEASSDSWTAPAILTTNELYDHQPALATLSDGRIILLWLRESADGTGDQQLIARMLSGDTWSAEAVIASDLRGVSEMALVSKGSEAQLVVSRDRDGNASTNDRDLALYTYRDGWSARRDVTSDPDDDRSPIASYDGDTARVYWLRDGRFVTRLLPDGPIELVRDEADRAAVTNPVAATGPDGAQTILWSSGSDLRAVRLDPTTKRWSSDIVLTDETHSHSSISGFFTPDGMLHLISLGTTIEHQDVSRVIDGVPVTIEDVGTPGRSDLISLDKILRIDLAAQGESIAVEPGQPAAGGTVTLRIDLQNLGDLPVHDALVELRRGDTAIATTTIHDDWMPGETKQATLAATYDPANPRLVVSVRTPNDAVPENDTAAYSFANRPPAACFQASAGSGGNPLTVTLDAACSADVDGRIARYAWSFSNTGGENGRSISHTFDTAGTQTVILTITDDMGASSTQSMTIDVGTSTDWRRSEATHTMHLSVVGRAAGVNGSFFVSDLALLNTDRGSDLTVDAVFLPDGRTDAYHKRIVLPAGALLQTRDVLAQLFGATNGTGSLRFDLSHPHAVAVARTYNDQPVGTAGFSNEALRREDALADGEKGIVLQHWLPGYRTNVGFTEIAGVASEVTATAYDESGTRLGSEVFALGPYQHTQINGRPLFQNRGRIEMEVRGGAVLAYGSTVDGKTGDPIYQTAERPPLAETGARTLLVPVVARLVGVNASQWRSDVRIFNPNSTTQTATLELRAPTGTFTKAIDIAAGQTASFDDVLTHAFPQVTGNVGGALTISAAAPLMASSRTFNLASDGTYGLYVPARTAEELLGEGEAAWLVQLQENATYRCNLGITSFDGPVAVTVRAFDGSGTTLATKSYGVAAGQNIQIGRIFADLGVPLPLDAGGLEVLVTLGRAFIYASVNDNRTGDGTFVEARR